MTARVRVQLFASAREAAGERLEVEVDPPVTAGAVLAALAARPELRAIAGRSRLAVNHAFAREGTPIAEGDEVALIPPVGGG